MRSKSVIALTCTWWATNAIACEDTLPIAEVTPERVFLMRQVHIDDRQPDGSRWVGTAAKAEGSLNESDFETVELTLTTADPERVYVVQAPVATMNFGTHKGIFRDLVVTDDQGGVLKAGVGHYDGNTGTLKTEGPMEFNTQQAKMFAPRGVIHLKSGTMTVTGPVTGKFKSTPPEVSSP